MHAPLRSLLPVRTPFAHQLRLARAVAALGLLFMACSPAMEPSPELVQKPAISRSAPPASLTAQWSEVAPMNQAREQHTATLLANGKVLVAGGYAGTGGLASAEVYDPDTNTWAPAGSMGLARNGHTATLLNNGKVLVAGGTGASHVSSINGLASAEV